MILPPTTDTALIHAHVPSKAFRTSCLHPVSISLLAFHSLSGPPVRLPPSPPHPSRSSQGHQGTPVLNPNVHSHSLSCLTSQNPLMHYPWKAFFTASLLSLISSTIPVLLFFLVPFPTLHSRIVTAIRDCSGPSFLSSCTLSLSHSVLNQHGIKCLLEALPFSSQS